MRFCLIIEEEYRQDRMPIVVADQLVQWGHEVDLLEPRETITNLSNLLEYRYDAYVLKAVADGPGQSILEAAEAAGILTINNSRAIRLVRDKAVAAAFALAHRLPIPSTYFVTHPRLLNQIPPESYPLVVKPSNGSSCRGIYRINTPKELDTFMMMESHGGFFLAQHYVENAGFDVKIYVTGREVYAAIARSSPLHGRITEKFIPLTPAMKKLALDVGRIFALDIYGIDVIETPQGLMVVDINDFPSYERVPGAVRRVAEYIIHAAKRAEIQRHRRLERNLRRRQAAVEKVLHTTNRAENTSLTDVSGIILQTKKLHSKVK
ncbi:MAG: ATP-grasp domain-containing protein [Chloroflexi bacterium]|nr:MAG: ATP-grasp domain-containing protein [Chloroflexota bacterium]